MEYAKVLLMSAVGIQGEVAFIEDFLVLGILVKAVDLALR